MGYNEPDDVAEYLTKCCGEDRCICEKSENCKECNNHPCDCDYEKEGDNEQ